VAKKKYIRVKRKLGTFKQESTVFRISDPCYDKDTWCAGTVDDVLPGTWTAYGSRRKIDDSWFQRRQLIALHSSYNGEEFKQTKIDGGMDAGMAGIFDDKYYKVDYSEDYLQVGHKEYYDRQDASSIPSDEHFYRSLIKSVKEILGSVQDKDNKKQLEENIEAWEKKIELLKQGEDPNPPKPTRDWYEVCCDKSLSIYGAGVIRNGCVSGSGYGDGGYTTLVAKNSKGKVVGVKLVY